MAAHCKGTISIIDDKVISPIRFDLTVSLWVINVLVQVHKRDI